MYDNRERRPIRSVLNNKLVTKKGIKKFILYATDTNCDNYNHNVIQKLFNIA